MSAHTCCPDHDEAADQPLTIQSADCQMLSAWETAREAGVGEWLGDEHDTPERAVHREGWIVLHQIEDSEAVLARLQTSRTELYVVADDGGAWAAQVAS